MKRVKAGLTKVTLSNEHEDSPFRLTLELPVLDDDDKSDVVQFDVKLVVKHPYRNVQQTLDATKFLIVLSEGGTIGLRVGGGNVLGSASFNVKPPYSLEYLRTWESALKKLSFIESRANRFGHFDLANGLRNDDLGVVDRVHSIVDTGEYRTTMDLSFTLAERPKLADFPDPGDTPRSLSVRNRAWWDR